MLYIIKVYEDGQIYEYEYGMLEHAQEHMRWERCYAELYRWKNRRIELIERVNSNKRILNHNSG